MNHKLKCGICKEEFSINTTGNLTTCLKCGADVEIFNKSLMTKKVEVKHDVWKKILDIKTKYSYKTMSDAIEHCLMKSKSMGEIYEKNNKNK